MQPEHFRDPAEMHHLLQEKKIQQIPVTCSCFVQLPWVLLLRASRRHLWTPTLTDQISDPGRNSTKSLIPKETRGCGHFHHGKSTDSSETEAPLSAPQPQTPRTKLCPRVTQNSREHRILQLGFCAHSSARGTLSISHFCNTRPTSGHTCWAAAIKHSMSLQRSL